MAPHEEHDDAGLNRAALFVLTLEKPVLAGVLKHLSSGDLTRLMQSYELLIGSGAPAKEQLVAAAKRFLESGDSSPTSHFKDALVIAFGSESAEQIFRQDHWRTIAEKIKPRALASVLKGERSEAVAIVLSQLPARYSAEVLSALPDDLRAESVDHLARSESVPNSTLDAILRAIEENFTGKVGLDETDQSAGARRAAAILNQLDSEIAAAIVERIRADDPARATAIEQEMFHFRDFLKLDNRALQQVLADIKPERLALALKGTSDAERNVVLEALADQVKAAVMQEMDDTGKVPLREVHSARREITDLALQMDREGKIRIRIDEDLVA
ncbi:MAG TPA: FliG C-terminal domain-containing protein [Candidatus Binataceae bacterium]